MCDTEDSVIRFEVGKVYGCRSTCDYDCIYKWKVVERTAKRLTLLDMNSSKEKPFVKGVSVYEGREKCSPMGKYSMSPTIWADRLAEDL